GSVGRGDRSNVEVCDVPVNPTVGQTQELRSNGLRSISQLIYDSIVDTLTTACSTISNDAYVDPVTKTTLTADEIDEMIDALVILAKNDLELPVASISTDVNVGQTKQLKTNESVIIRQLISDAIVDSVGLTATIPDDAYVDSV